MKKFTTSIACVALVAALQAQTQGPNSSVVPYLVKHPSVPTVSITSILTAGNAIGTYSMAGIPDGLGSYDNNDGTYTILLNHELGNGLGAVHAYGQPGTFVSKWTVNKTTHAVTAGSDLTQNVKLWNVASSTYSTYNAGNTSPLTNMGRYCSGDLAPVEAYYNKFTNTGTKDRIYLNGEETGNEGRMFAHIATGTEAGTSYEIPHLGKHSCENQVASAHSGSKTVVIGMDDSTPGQVYVYVGDKSNTGSVIEKAGLFGGKLYGVQAIVGGSPIANETNALNIPANSTFSLVAVGNNGDVSAITGGSLQTQSNNLGITNFLRPEDGAFDPSSPNDFYFVTTNSMTQPSRMWRLRFINIEQPELGGTITPVIDGTEIVSGYAGVPVAQNARMMDNITIDHSGHILIVEDAGNNVHIGRVLQYDIATDVISPVAYCDSTRFLNGGANFITQDEEASGITDAQEILGAGWFLSSIQVHASAPPAIVEQGQLVALYNPASALNPEIDIEGNSVAIASGNTAFSTGNNTDFGTAYVGAAVVQKPFVIKNTGNSTLYISKLVLSGADASSFTITNSPWAFPAVIAPGGSQTISISFNPAAVGTKSAIVNVVSNDYNETFYDFAVKASAGVNEINVQGNGVNIVAGASSASASDNTDFGSQQINTSSSKSFIIQNTGTLPLTISGITFNGANASEFTLQNAPSFPLVIAGSASQTFSVQFLPTTAGTRTTNIVITNNDTDESNYAFILKGEGIDNTTGVEDLTAGNSSVILFPNPNAGEVTVRLNLENAATVSVKVFDVQGKLVSTVADKNLNNGVQEISVSTKELANGNYFVRVSNNGNVTTLKMTVAH
ncbi:MAG: choice-of-anchor D domain-containing protein [Bacteroidetes bacterium]|nr:choice-of-anchor D domain-containing protein [Bacteroidota bacterium]